MEPSTGDEPTGQSRGGWLSDAGAVDASLALADPPPSMTAAHWANRDNETLYRRPGQSGTPRRPPAENSFPEDTGVIRLPRRPQVAPADDSGYPYPGAGTGPTRPGQPHDGGQADERSRHWTTVGTETRRPPTADRGEQTAPPPSGGPPLAMPPLAAPPTTAPPLAGPALNGPALNGAPLNGSPMSGAPMAGSPMSGSPMSGSPMSGAPDPRGSAGPSGRPGPAGDTPAPGYGYGSGRPAADSPPSGRPSSNGSPSGRPSSNGSPSGRPQAGGAQSGGPQGGRSPSGGPQGGSPVGAQAGRGRQPGPRDHASDEIGVLGGPGRDIRPHRATAGSGREKPAKDAGAPRRRSRGPLVLGLMVSVVTLAGAGTAAAAVFTGKPAAVAAVLGTEDDTDTGESRTATAPLQGRTESAFEIVTATTQMTMRSEDLGDDLYRITTPADSDALPRPVVDGDRVQLQLTPTGDGGASGVEVVLNSKVRWALRFAGGSDEQRVDMGQGRVASVDIAGGARRFELTLPPASGTVGIRLAGAVDEFVVTAPKESPVRVQAVSGVKTVAAGAKTLRDVKPGSTITPKDWQVDNRYDIDAAGKVTLLSITNEG